MNHLWTLAVISLLVSVVDVHLQHIPNCDFHDTVRLKNSHKLANGSYMYEGLVIPDELVGNYSHFEAFAGEIVPITPHVRACVCKLKKCIRFCCHPKRFSANYEDSCSKEVAEEPNFSPYVNVTFNNGTTKPVHTMDEYVIQMGFPCSTRYFIDGEAHLQWKLFENGTILRIADHAYFEKRDFCFWPQNATGPLTPIFCATRNIPEKNIVWNAVGMMVSAPFMLITALVYLWIPELRTLHGKCLVCYLIPMAIGYGLMGTLLWSDSYPDRITCTNIGFTVYFCLVSAFMWLSVISFDLWYNFRGNSTSGLQRLSQNRRFLAYSLYAWGLAVIFTVITIFCQYSNIDDVLKPGIGTHSCWLSPNDWSAMIYFYDLMLIIIVFNTVMFVLSALKVLQLKRQFESMENHEGHKRLVNQKDLFMLFLRLFILMGISWLLEVIAYLWGPNGVFYVSDFCNAIQGVIIFLLFVCRPKVRRLVMARLYSQHWIDRVPFEQHHDITLSAFEKLNDRF